MVAGICAFYTASSCIVAAAMTAGITIVLTLYAFCTKRDFTVLGGVITVVSFVLFGLIMMMWLFTFPAWWHPVFAAVMVCFYGFFLIYDT